MCQYFSFIVRNIQHRLQLAGCSSIPILRSGGSLTKTQHSSPFSSSTFLNRTRRKMAFGGDDVQKQIRHMTAFIEQEANEKAEEIDAKAEEEFNIEKGRLVQHQRRKIIEYFERKERQVELQKKIQSSNMLNEARLQTLKVREDHVNEVLNDVQKRLVKVSSDEKLYREVLKKLILQAILQLLEKNVTIRVREVDVSVVESIIDEVAADYKAVSNKEINLKLDTSSFLAPETCGGIELLAQKDKIKICNTLESRLELIAQQLVPVVQTALFGKNPNRKFAE